jgi:hypothetical protein
MWEMSNKKSPAGDSSGAFFYSLFFSSFIRASSRLIFIISFLLPPRHFGELMIALMSSSSMTIWYVISAVLILSLAFLFGEAPLVGGASVVCLIISFAVRFLVCVVPLPLPSTFGFFQLALGLGRKRR